MNKDHRTIKTALLASSIYLIMYQSRTQSRLAFWSAGGRQERLCGTMEAVSGAANQKKNFFFEFSIVSPGAHPLTKKPEDSGYEIDHIPTELINLKFDLGND